MKGSLKNAPLGRNRDPAISVEACWPTSRDTQVARLMNVYGLLRWQRQLAIVKVI